MSTAFSLGVINIPLAEVFARLGTETREDRLAIRVVQSASLMDFARQVNPMALSAEFRGAAIVALEKDGRLYGDDDLDARAQTVRAAWTLAVPHRIIQQRRNRAKWLAVLAASLQAAADRERTRIAERLDPSISDEEFADAVEYGSVGEFGAEVEALREYASECASAVVTAVVTTRAALAVQIALIAAIFSVTCATVAAYLAVVSSRLSPHLHGLPHLALSPRLLARPRACRALTAAV